MICLEHDFVDLAMGPEREQVEARELEARRLRIKRAIRGPY